MKLAGKVAIVTGSGGVGAGRAIAWKFASEGAHVLVTDINEAGAHESGALIEASGGRATVYPADLTRENDVRALVAFAEERFGRLDILVNSASSGLFHPDQPLAFWNEIIAVDLLGTLWATRFAIEAMRRAGGGAIVNVSSTSALAHGRLGGGNGSPSYDVAKIGVLRLTTMLGFLGAKENIRVNCIAPDWIAVPELQRYFDSLTPEQLRANGVPARLTSLDEIAAAVLKLATDESLYGRVLVWWSDDPPGLIAQGDRGYSALQTIDTDPGD